MSGGAAHRDTSSAAQTAGARLREVVETLRRLGRARTSDRTRRHQLARTEPPDHLRPLRPRDRRPLAIGFLLALLTYGAFYDTPLMTILGNLARDTVIICGTLTNCCGGTTARQAYERGFQVVFGSDITATDDPDMQEAELMVLRKGFARVMTADEIRAEL